MGRRREHLHASSGGARDRKEPHEAGLAGGVGRGAWQGGTQGREPALCAGRTRACIQVLAFLLDQGGATPRICMHLFCLSSCHVVYWATTQPCSPSICRARYGRDMDEIWGLEKARRVRSEGARRGRCNQGDAIREGARRGRRRERRRGRAPGRSRCKGRHRRASTSAGRWRRGCIPWHTHRGKPPGT